MTALDETPILIAHEGKLKWQCADGRLLHYVAGGDDPDPPEKVFTQADVDRIVQDRLGRVKAEPPADYASLQEAKAELDKLRAKDQTELDAAKAEATRIAAERDTAAAERDAAKNDARDLKLRAAVVREAAKQKAVDPDDVFALLPVNAVTIGDDGQVTGAEAAVKALLEAKPHLVGQRQGPRPDPAQGPRPDAKPSVSAGREMFESRRKPAGAGAS